jgi:hypothetical protein
MRAWTLSVCLALVAAGSARAETAIWTFRWEGANGYAMTGALAFDAAIAERRLVTERDLACFAITGTRDGRVLGRWSLGALTPDTSWRLHFDGRAGVFLVEGMGVRMPQAWNMNGRGDDCGEDGFGFNVGNLGQDVCVDGALVESSRIDPPTPLPATRVQRHGFPRGACRLPDLLSRLRPGAAEAGES